MASRSLSFTDELIESLETVRRSHYINALYLGGSSGSNGGTGGPPGGVVGKLIQTHSCYDSDEFGVSSGSTSLLDNLNHIRYRIGVLEANPAYVSFTPGSVVYASTSGSLTEDNANFYYDDANDALLVGDITHTSIVSANHAIHVANEGGAARLRAISVGTNSVIAGYRINTSFGSPSALASGNLIMSLSAIGYTGSGVSASAVLRGYASEDWTSGSAGARWSVYLAPNASTTTRETVRFEQDGELYNMTSGSAFYYYHEGNIANETVPLDSIQFSLAPTVTIPSEGLMYWNIDEGTLNIGMPGGNVNLQIGQEILRKVRNETGSDITNGKLVYISGSTGDKLLVSLAQANSATTASPRTIYMLTEDIDNNSFGYSTWWGDVHDVDTNGWPAGTALWLSATTPGAFTPTRPSAPNYKVKIGGVLKSGVSNGIVTMSQYNGGELNDIADVEVSSPQNLDIMTYYSSGSYWRNTGTSSGSSGYFYKPGIDGGQIAYGGVNHFDNLYLRSTTGSPGTVYIADTGGVVQIGPSTTTPQVSVWSSSGNRVDLTVGATGSVTFDAVGAGAAFDFMDYISVKSETNAQVRIIRASADASGAYVTMQKARGTLAAPALLQNNDQCGSVNFMGWDTNYVDTAYIQGYAAENWAAGKNHGSQMRLYITNKGSTVPTEYQRWYGDGYIVHYVKTYTVSTATPQRTTQYDGSNYFTESVSSTGAVTFDAVGAWANFIFSDKVGVGITPTQLIHVYGPSPRMLVQSSVNGNNLGVYFAGNDSGGNLKAGGIYYYPGTTSPTTYIGLSSDNTTIGAFLDRNNYFSIGAATAGARLHVLLSNATTNAVDAAQIIGHNSSGSAVEKGFGSVLKFQLESSTTDDQDAAQLATLWTDPTHLSRTALLRGAVTGNAVNSYFGSWGHSAISNTALTVIPDGTGDVASVVSFFYAAYDNTNGGTNGGTVTIKPGESAVTLLSDGTDTLQITCAANGSVTVVRSAGTHTFKLTLWGTWC